MKKDLCITKKYRAIRMSSFSAFSLIRDSSRVARAMNSEIW